MSGSPPRSVILLPPPGPLSWLHPELQAFEPRPRKPGLVHDLVDLERERPDRVRMPPGPRAAAVRGVLQQRWRPAVPAFRLDVGLPCLERHLEAAAAAAVPAPSDTFVVASMVDPRAASGEPLTAAVAERLAVGAAQRNAPLWLLPLLPGPGLDPLLERCLHRVEQEPELFQAAGLLPFFRTDQRHPPGPVTTRLPATWWGLLPGDEYAASTRALFRQLLALLQPQRLPMFLALETHALGGFDLYAEALAGRDLQPAAPAVPRRPLLVACCGIDGSGKSTHMAALRSWLQQQGLRVAVHKIYRHGVFHDTVTDLARSCIGDRHLHLWRMERLAKLFDSVKYWPRIAADMTNCDVLLFDRYVFTHFAAGTGRSHHDPFARELLAMFPPPHCTFLLDLPAEAAMARLGERSARTIDENPYMLERYRQVLRELAAAHGMRVLDAGAPFEHNQAAMRAVVERALQR